MVVQRYLPYYRLRFFDRLHEALRSGGRSLTVIHGRTMGDFPAPCWSYRLPALGVKLKLRATEEVALVSIGLRRKLRSLAPALVVVEDLGAIPTNLFAARYCLASGRPYLVWGLGRIPGNPGSRLRTLLRPVIDWLYGHAAGFIGYSSYAAAVYGAYGKPCHVALNSALEAPTPAQEAQTLAAIDARGTDRPLRLVTIGRLLRQKRLDVLVEAVRRMSDPAVELHVVGAGPEEAALRARAAEEGSAGRFVFHGSVYDELRKGELLRRCDLGVLPGRGGLAIQELMWNGLPVAAGLADGTERDLLTDANGYRLDRMPSVDDLVGIVRTHARRSREERNTMARAALQTVLDVANLERMVDGYLGAIETHLKG